MSTSPSRLLFLLSGEIRHHAEEAGRHGLALLQGQVPYESLWSTTYSFVYSAATVASMFTPGNRRKVLADAFPDRPAELRKLFEVDEGDLVGIRELRNDLAHIDERYEKFWMDDPNHNIVIRLAGRPESVHMEGTRFHCWDPTRGELTFLGSSVDVSAITVQMGLLARRAEVVCEQLWRA